MSDPFASIPAADPAQCETRPRSRHAQASMVVDPLGNSSAKPKKTDFNPKQKAWFEKHGYTWARVEHANAWGAVTIDLWGFADYMAVRGEETLLVQTCRRSDMATRLRKSEAVPELREWLTGGGRRFEVHGWDQAANRRWQVKRVAVELRDGKLVRVAVGDLER